MVVFVVLQRTDSTKDMLSCKLSWLSLVPFLSGKKLVSTRLPSTPKSYLELQDGTNSWRTPTHSQNNMFYCQACSGETLVGTLTWLQLTSWVDQQPGIMASKHMYEHFSSRYCQSKKCNEGWLNYIEPDQTEKKWTSVLCCYAWSWLQSLSLSLSWMLWEDTQFVSQNPSYDWVKRLMSAILTYLDAPVQVYIARLSLLVC